MYARLGKSLLYLFHSVSSFLVHLIDLFGFVLAKLVLVQSSCATIKERIKPAGVFAADPSDHGLD